MATPTLTRRFAVRPEPELREGAFHYLLRLSEANGFTARWVWRRIGASRTGLLSYLREEVTVDALAMHAPELDSTWITRYARVCPRCLEEQDGRDSIGWEIRYADACIHHRCWLVDQCRCGERLKPLRARLNQCRCGVRLSSLETREAPSPVVTLSALLISSVSTTAPALLDERLAHGHPYRSFHFHELHQLIRIFGFYGDPSSPLRYSGERRSLLMSDSWSITSLAAEIIVDWPNAFHRLLAWNHSHNEDMSTRRLSHAFGRLYHHLYVTLRHSQFDFIRTELESYLTVHWPAVSGGNRERTKHIERDRWRWWPLRRACTRLGISKTVLLDLVDRGELVVDRRLTVKGRERIFVRGPRLNGTTTPLSDSFLTCYDAAKRLGLTRRRFRCVVASWFPNAWKGSDKVWRIPASEVDALLDIGSPLTWISARRKSLTTLGHALQYLNLTTPDLALIVQRARNDPEHRPVARQGRYRGLSSWAFERAYLDSIMKAPIKRVHGEEAGFVSVRQLADRWGLRRRAVYKLLHSGVLKISDLVRAHRREGMIALDEIESFERRYVFAVDISKRVQWSPMMVLETLKSHQITVAFADCNQGRAVFERTPELEIAIQSIEAMLSKQPRPPKRIYKPRHRSRRSETRHVETLQAAS